MFVTCPKILNKIEHSFINFSSSKFKYSWFYGVVKELGQESLMMQISSSGSFYL